MHDKLSNNNKELREQKQTNKKTFYYAPINVDVNSKTKMKKKVEKTKAKERERETHTTKC